jgi:soluble lytic murein transglycosylase-like protein
MKRLLMLAWFAALSTLPFTQVAQAGHSEYDSLIATHAAANNVPEALVHRVILRESRYQPNLVGRCGCIGLMQIKLATARSLGYTGDAQGLRDPNTNLTYGVKYLAGAYRAANGDHSRAVHYFAAGYYEAAKHQRLQQVAEVRHGRSGRARAPLDITPKKLQSQLPHGSAEAQANATGAAGAPTEVPSQ